MELGFVCLFLLKDTFQLAKQEKHRCNDGWNSIRWWLTETMDGAMSDFIMDCTQDKLIVEANFCWQLN